jgi:hypothetical protein
MRSNAEEAPVFGASGAGMCDIRTGYGEGRSKMDRGQRTTGTRDEHYNLVSVLYHALHGAENTERYAADAEAAGDERLTAFFRETQAVQSQVAERAKGLLGILEPPDAISGGVRLPTPGYPANEVTPRPSVPGTPPGPEEQVTDG